MTPEFDIDLLPLDNSYFAQLACRNHLALLGHLFLLGKLLWGENLV